MTVDEYLKTYDISPTWFAAKTGASVASIKKYAKGGRPTMSIAQRIVHASKGLITYEDLGYACPREK